MVMQSEENSNTNEEAEIKDFKSWLLSFEKSIGNKPCVVSLLIQNSEIHFLTCTAKKLYLQDSLYGDEGDESDSAGPGLKKGGIKLLKGDASLYIG